MVVNRYGRGGGGGDGDSSSIRQREREAWFKEDRQRKSQVGRRKMGAREMEKTHQLTTYLHVDLTHWMRTKGTLSYLPKI